MVIIAAPLPTASRLTTTKVRHFENRFDQAASAALISTRLTISIGPFILLMADFVLYTSVIITIAYLLVTVFASYTEALRVKLEIIIHLIQIHCFLPEHIIRSVVNALVSELHRYVWVLVIDRDV